jgi:hypothetical protein
VAERSIGGHYGHAPDRVFYHVVISNLADRISDRLAVDLDGDDAVCFIDEAGITNRRERSIGHSKTFWRANHAAPIDRATKMTSAALGHDRRAPRHSKTASAMMITEAARVMIGDHHRSVKASSSPSGV